MKVMPEKADTGLPKESHKPRAHLPIDSDWADRLKPGTKVSFVVSGKVESYTLSDDGSSYPRQEVCLELSEVNLKEAENEFSRLAEDDE